MKINEFRIGNLIETPRGVEKIVEVHRHHLMFAPLGESPYVTYPLDLCKDVLLTVEWLENLGFKRLKRLGNYGYIFARSCADIDYTVERDWRPLPSHFFGVEYTDSNDPCDSGKSYNFSFEVKSVHRLQNLFFTCTGEELVPNVENSISYNQKK